MPANDVDLNDLFFEKTDKDIAPGIKTAAKVILNSTKEDNPFTQNKAIFDSSAYWRSVHNSYENSTDWLARNIDAISDYLYREYAVEKIRLDAHIFEIPSEDNGFNISPPYESASIMHHFQGLGELAAYNITSIKHPLDTLKCSEDELVRKYFEAFKTSLSDKQLKSINYILPNFFSDYGLDSDPVIVSEVCIDNEKLGTGRRHYIDVCLKPNKEQLMPIFHGKTKEIYLVMAPMENLLDSNRIKKHISKKTGVSENKIMSNKINLDFNIHDLQFSTAMHPAYFFEAEADPKVTRNNVDDIARRFLKVSQRDIATVLSAGASCEFKGKNEYETDISKRIFYLFGNGPSISVLGNLYNYHPIDEGLVHESGTSFNQYKNQKTSKLTI